MTKLQYLRDEVDHVTSLFHWDKRYKDPFMEIPCIVSAHLGHRKPVNPRAFTLPGTNALNKRRIRW